MATIAGENPGLKNVTAYEDSLEKTASLDAHSVKGVPRWRVKPPLAP